MKAIAIYNHKCKRCGHEWQSVNKRPVVCPRCKSYKWDEKAGQRPTQPGGEGR
jgi:predicted Zn-ribbon and HTH transcriptional regulator